MVAEGVKLHRKGRVMKAQSIQFEDDVFSFQGGRSTGIVKFLEPFSPLLNYFEVLHHFMMECSISLSLSLLLTDPDTQQGKGDSHWGGVWGEELPHVPHAGLEQKQLWLPCR